MIIHGQTGMKEQEIFIIKDGTNRTKSILFKGS